MPLYDFRCSYKPHVVFESLRKSPEDLPRCPCGDRDCKPERLLAAPRAQFRGSGFYETDYKKKS